MPRFYPMMTTKTLKKSGKNRVSQAVKYRNYEKVLVTHDALEMVNETINSLGLVPQGF